ncbi:methylated-DNA--[protein]-cysteine S-methyltransferase [Lutimonas halocynthiae]|uniref:methylated-DNA--[protein]-cysteine S-methyltransferase n=1 Tax=Lutimonas halocynthiae TaxID=1446477 RepID=UPI0025B2D75E|nr:methylated-DNA--[protein]-cysteine S-methyltransferase [Lutimonas halocynthiae]MDN3643465.1 methylated-DNA--[protein]-cysteine S-methyltransferase [Lutimonas halocynthiae]
MSDNEQCFFKTPIGTARIVGNQEGISEISVLNEELDSTQLVPEVLLECVKQLTEYFEGERKDFSIKINPKGTDFQKTVWDELLNIPFGKRTTYMKQTLKLGNEKAIRAVASANGKNPIWIVIPCHRVVGSDGSLTGYAGGLWRKNWLLEHESPSGQTSLF